MKDISRRIFEKENQAEVSNNPRQLNKSLTQLVSLTMINNTRKAEFKGIDIKNTQVSVSQRPLVFCKPEQRVKTLKTIPSPQKQSQERSNESQSKELCNLIQNYSEPILDYYTKLDTETPKNSLQNHSINANLRAKMIDWIVEVLSSYKCKDQTFHLSIRLMDLYLSKTTQKHLPQDLHLVGVSSMFIACKYEEIYPVKLQVVYEKIAHKKLSKEEIKDKEANILQVLDFNLNGTTILDIITMVLSILNLHQQLYEAANFLAKLALFDYEFVNQYSYLQLACAVLIVSTKTIEQIDQNLSSEVTIPLIISTLKLDYQDSIACANRLLQLAKGFDKQFPNFENLKKFSKFQISDIMQTQC
ncbi:unnamed protein product (macronuclear) [Paramecium tetraurelia]|uniref:Cyclin-like domain-containing protein n=1 Tax=Paramecium tetraurelia TaxID=5888 RepID=A0EGF6_PARTE|nr:uncharacterized protein GSPATT00026721001 [Paramecium tetraurelia]CAK94397.1 unnamed protein product [Paramecium tetraurelia]|eukprot:XP_001461770.1 hypothetical protein (macronuclear) [Paramecium tetraurelia strain d4-2]